MTYSEQSKKIDYIIENRAPSEEEITELINRVWHEIYF